ncbi:MAG: hypothetical protein AAGC64_12970 [Bacteroidota bacterium]
MEVNPELEARVKEFLRQGKRVEAVDLVQEVLQCGLLQAKRLCRYPKDVVHLPT